MGYGDRARLAIVHERFTEFGGSEAVVAEWHRVWPDAPIFTTVADQAVVEQAGLRDARIRPSALQRLYRGGPGYAHLLALLPSAMRSLELSGFDVVLTSHHAFANRVRVAPGTRRVSYVYTPARWMWDAGMRAQERANPLARAALGAFSATQRPADRRAAARVDRLLVDSSAVADRVSRWWGLGSRVVHPPVDTDFYTPDAAVAREPFFLVAGRLVPYKRPEVAVAAARRAGVRLVVVGEGRSRAAVEAAAGPGTELLGRVDDETLRDLFRRCRALLFPGVEDFGIVPVEAQACGAPVIAVGAGGALDTVVDGVTGHLYPPGDDVGALADQLTRFSAERFDPERIRRHAEGFSAGRFRAAMRDEVEAVVGP